MGRRAIGVVVALVLALTGTVALISYVQKAADRAQAGETEVQVLVASSRIPAGTPSDHLNSLVEAKSVARKSVPEGAVGNLDTLEGLIASADIFPGEQLVTQRFVEPGNYVNRGLGVELPDDMLELTVQLSSERTIGGILTPGQRVAILVTFNVNEPGTKLGLNEDGELISLPGDDGEISPVSGMTDTLLHHVLVTAVQESGANYSTQQERSEARLSAPPGGSLSVTFALRPYDAERVVFARQFGDIWLALERDTVSPQRDPAKEFDNLFVDESVAG